MKMYYENERINGNYTMVTDAYEYTMSNGYLQTGQENVEVVFDAFFRRVPNGGGYAIMAGIDQVIEFIKNLKYSEADLQYFRDSGYPENFVEYLKNFKFTGTIKAVPDGTPVFPNEPLITVKAPIMEAQLIETALLAILNGAMSHATGARRIVEACPEGVSVMEFGARRADGLNAAIDASIYGLMAGCAGTSNIKAAEMLGQKALGTMAHSWVEAFDTEYEAFLNFAKIYPDNCFLLVDTYNTLKSGIPNAIKVFEYMRNNGMNLDHIGIRIDSGDIAYLTKEARKMLDEAGFTEAKICISNGLKAETIESLILQGAKFDLVGVGDNISKPEGNIGCVYKLVAVKNKEGKYVGKIKLSEDAIKIVNPGFKKIYRVYDKDTGYALADVMCEYNEELNENEMVIVSTTDYLKSKKISNYDIVELQQVIFEDGNLVYDDPELSEKAAYCEQQMVTIYPEVKRTMNPHEYYVDGTEQFVEYKRELIKKARKGA